MYDAIAKRIPAWGYVYAFTELGFGHCLPHQFQSAYNKCSNLFSNDSQHHWRFTKRVKQKENSVRLFGSSFQFAHEHGYHYWRCGDDCHEWRNDFTDALNNIK